MWGSEIICGFDTGPKLQDQQLAQPCSRSHESDRPNHIPEFLYTQLFSLFMGRRFDENPIRQSTSPEHDCSLHTWILGYDRFYMDRHLVFIGKAKEKADQSTEWPWVCLKFEILMSRRF